MHCIVLLPAILVTLKVQFLEAWILFPTGPLVTRTGPRRISPLPWQQQHSATTTTSTASSLTVRGAFSADDNDASYDESSVVGDDDELSDEELAETMGEWNDEVARYNSVHLTGRIGGDPEPRYFDDGKVVVNLSLATRRKYHSIERSVQKIEWGEEETDWYGLEIWGQTAEFVTKFVDKGARVGVIGMLQVDTWIDKETGETRSRPKIVVRELDLLESKAEADLRRGGNRRSSYNGGDNDEDNYSPSKAGSGGFFDM